MISTQVRQATLLNLLDDDTFSLVADLKMGMELWEGLITSTQNPTLVDHAITAYDSIDWNTSWDGDRFEDSDEECWENSVAYAYVCATIWMGEALGFDIEGPPDVFFVLSPCPRRNYRIAKDCCVAFIELLDVESHDYYMITGIPPLSPKAWKDRCLEDYSWQLWGEYDWRRDAIEDAFEEAKLL